MSYSLCLFDLDGTLTNPKEGITKSVQYALARFGIEVENLDTLVDFIGPPLRESFQKFYGFSPEQAEQAIAAYREYYTRQGIFENELYEGCDRLLGTLARRGVRMAMATSKPAVFAEKIAVHYNIRQYFDFIAGSELDGTRDRKSEVILHALLNVDPTQSLRRVMIGDRKHDVQGAKQTDTDCIGVTWGYGSRQELETAGALYTVDTINQLLDLL